jgi:hypothetical protein
MAAAKRKCDDASDYVDGSQKKRSKASRDKESLGFHYNPDDCGTLASQRPKRTRKVPARFVELSPQPPRKKRKVTKSESTTRTQQEVNSKQLTVAEDEKELQIEGPAVHAENVLQTPKKESNILRLKVSFNGAAPCNSSQNNDDEDTESELSSPPASSPAQSPVSVPSHRKQLLSTDERYRKSTLYISSRRLHKMRIVKSTLYMLNHRFRKMRRANAPRMCQNRCQHLVKR